MKKMVLILLFIFITIQVMGNVDHKLLMENYDHAREEFLSRYDYGISTAYLPTSISMAIGCMEYYPVYETVSYWDVENSQWVETYTYQFTYEDGYLIESAVTIDMQGQIFVMTATYTWEDDLVTEVLGTTTVMNMTMNNMHETFTYTDTDIWETYHALGWMPDQEIWVDTDMWTATIESEKITQVLKEYYDHDVSGWVPDERENIEWEGDQITNDLSEYCQDGTWYDYTRGSMYYLPSGLMDYSVHEYCEMDNWIYEYQNTYTYDGGLHTYTLTESWDEGSWAENEEEYISYDSSDRPVLIEQFEMIDGVWVEESKIELFYTLETDEINLPQAKSNISIYPNPFNPETTICWENGVANGTEQLNIYNIQGEKVFSAPIGNDMNGFGQYIWNGTDLKGNILPSGIYLVKISEKYHPQKLMLLK